MTLFIWSQLVLVCLLGAMSPGPSLAVVIRNSIIYNRIAGISTAIGHGLGMSLYASIAIIGLGIILKSFLNLFIFIQILELRGVKRSKLPEIGPKFEQNGERFHIPTY